MSLYPNIRDSDSDGSSSKFLEELSHKIDTGNNELNRLFMDLQTDPNSPELLHEIILSIIKSPKNSSLTTRLAAYLKSHVELLEAITHNVELASLFLVGENGEQTFTSIHRSILNEQAGRTRMFLATNEVDESEIRVNLADYRNFVSNVSDLPTKLSALDSIVNESLQSNDIQQLHNAYQEIAALFSGCLVFNDILIQNKSIAKNNDDTIESSDIPKEFPNAPLKKDEFVSWVKDKAKTSDCAFQNVIRLEEENKRLISNIRDLQNQLEVKNRENKSLKRQLSDNISIIQEQKNDLTQKMRDIQEKLKDYASSNQENDSLKNENMRLQQKLNQISAKAQLDSESIQSENDSLKGKIMELQDDINRKESKIASLKEKINQLKEGKEEFSNLQRQSHNELSDLQRLYQNATSSLYQTKEKIRELKTENSNLKGQLSDQQKENQDIKQMLLRAQGRVKEQMEENEVLLKQLRKKGTYSDDEVHDLKAEISSLKRKLHDANKFIAKLQREIEEFRRKQGHSITTRHHHSSVHRSHHYRSYNDYHGVECESFSNNNDDSTSYESLKEQSPSPGLQDLDREIKKLERNVSLSRKVLQEKK